MKNSIQTMSDDLIKILGVNINLLDIEFIKTKIMEVLNSKNNSVFCIATINIEFIILAQKNEDFKKYLNFESSINTVDGVGILNVLKWYNIDFNKRVCGSDLVYELAEICNNMNKKYFILGASEEVSNKAKEKLKQMYKNLQIDNYSPPYTKALSFDIIEDMHIKNKISEFKPDVLCVAFGAPKQELWIKEHKKYLESIGVKVVIGLGGSFDFVAGKVKRAPRIFKDTGNEWLYRLIKEPKLRFKRQISTIPLYYMLCLLEFVRNKF